jgi:hypothetical protein
MCSLLLVESFDLRASNQQILVRAIPSCFRLMKMCLSQIGLLSRCSPRYLTSSSWGVVHCLYGPGGGGGHFVNVTWIDLDPLVLILHSSNQFWIASRLVCICVMQWLDHCAWLVLQYRRQRLLW